MPHSPISGVQKRLFITWMISLVTHKKNTKSVKNKVAECKAPPGTEIASLGQVSHLFIHFSTSWLLFIYCPLRNRKILTNFKILLIQVTVNEGFWRKLIDLENISIRWFRVISLDWQTEEKPESIDSFLVPPRTLCSILCSSAPSYTEHCKGGAFQI